jgi:hypothetical protein
MNKLPVASHAGEICRAKGIRHAHGLQCLSSLKSRLS